MIHYYTWWVHCRAPYCQITDLCRSGLRYILAMVIPDGMSIWEGQKDEDQPFVGKQMNDMHNDEIPPHLQLPSSPDYVTIVNVSGVHFCKIHYCTCTNSKSFHMQLLYSSCFPSTIESPQTVFTFSVLDDFICDNLECGTSTSNYYSKLHRIILNTCLHLVLVMLSAAETLIMTHYKYIELL